MCVFLSPHRAGSVSPGGFTGGKEPNRVFQSQRVDGDQSLTVAWMVGNHQAGRALNRKRWPGRGVSFLHGVVVWRVICLSKTTINQANSVCVPVNKILLILQKSQGQPPFECINPVVNNGSSNTILNLLAGYLVAINTMALFVWKCPYRSPRFLSRTSSWRVMLVMELPPWV